MLSSFSHFKCLLFLIPSVLGSGNGQISSCPDVVNGKMFDFVVVGAGTAGCTVAARIAETGKYSVLLIEAGGVTSPELDIPALLRPGGDPKFSRYYPTAPEHNSTAANEAVPYIAGKAMGGGSAINGMIFNRGHPKDYDAWAELTGDQSWSYASLLKYFEKVENHPGGNEDEHGFAGPIFISRPQFAPGKKAWLQAGAELGYPVTEDGYGPQTKGFSSVNFSRKQGRRVSSFQGYIEPLLQSNNAGSNLTILMYSEATRIHFEGRRPVGINFTSSITPDCEVVTGYVKAGKEIILSAGVIETPTILMRSGIGPKLVLDKAKIRLIKELPVGDQLHDHVVYINDLIFGNKSAAVDYSTELTPEAWRIFEETGDGPYASHFGAGGQAFMTSSKAILDWPDLQLSQLNYVKLNASDDEVLVSCAIILVRPKSRGSVTLDPLNIDNPPLIDFQLLTDPYDIPALIDGIKLLVKICQKTKAFQEIGCRLPREPLPACNHFPYLTDPYWECVVRQQSFAGFHAGGTARMGKGDGAVVDSQLRVIGIKGLRIVDGSIMPALPNANTQASVYVIAEKAADMIKQEWEYSGNSSAISSTDFNYLPGLVLLLIGFYGSI